MEINASTLDALFISFSKNFADAYMGTPAPLAEAVATRIASTTRDQRYPIVQSISGAMREWKGERQAQNLYLDGLVITNKLWENTIAIQKLELQFDQYSMYSDMIIPNLARHAKLLVDQQIAAEIAANRTGYDGKAFFATDHPVDPSGATPGTAMSNLSTGKPLNNTNLAAIQALMMNFVGPDGLPMGCYGDTLLVPPSLKYTADTLANATFYPATQNASSGVFGAQSNVFQGAYKVVTSPWIADSGDPATAVWYLLDCRMDKLRPFFWQEFEAANLTSMVDPSNPIVFLQDKFMFGARAVGNSAAALWFKAFKVSGA